jgi:uncharacterized protein YjbJ (UPF0337 family)
MIAGKRNHVLTPELMLVPIINVITIEEQDMNKDRIQGSAEQAKGKIKETAGKAIGDKRLVQEGKGDQIKGKMQNAVGGLMDALRGK